MLYFSIEEVLNVDFVFFNFSLMKFVLLAIKKKKIKPNQTKTWIILLNQDIGTESVSKYLFELSKLFTFLSEINEIKPNHNQTELASTSMFTRNVGPVFSKNMQNWLVYYLLFLRREKKTQYWCKPNRLRYRNQNWTGSNIVPSTNTTILCFLKTEKKKSLKEEEGGWINETIHQSKKKKINCISRDHSIERRKMIW